MSGWSKKEIEDAQDLINEILDWAEANTHFDPSFVTLMAKVLEDKEYLSPRQYGALANIKDRWKIGEQGVESDEVCKQKFVARNAAQFNRGRAPASRPPGTGGH
jgi:hypothetical protein